MIKTKQEDDNKPITLKELIINEINNMRSKNACAPYAERKKTIKEIREETLADVIDKINEITNEPLTGVSMPKPMYIDPKARYMFEIRRIFIEPEKINDGLVFSELTQIVCTEDEVEEYMQKQQGKTNTYCVQIKSKKEIY